MIPLPASVPPLWTVTPPLPVPEPGGIVHEQGATADGSGTLVLIGGREFHGAGAGFDECAEIAVIPIGMEQDGGHIKINAIGGAGGHIESGGIGRIEQLDAIRVATAANAAGGDDRGS